MPNTPLPAARKPCAPMLTALALSLSACATPSPPQAPPAPMRLPAPPPLTEPAPSPSYLETVQQTLKAWRQRLTATPATP